MVIIAGQVIPSINAANSFIGDTKIGYDLAEQIADVLVALEHARKKLAILQKHAMGGKESITKDDENFEEIVRLMAEVGEKEIEIDVAPISAALLREAKAEISPGSLAMLKIAGLVA